MIRRQHPALAALVMVTACGTASTPVAAPASAPGTSAAEVEARLEAMIPRLMAAGDVPGLAIGLVRDGQLVWQGSFGVADAATRRPVTPATVFEAASLSKPVFAYAVMKLVDAGKLDLDRPLTEYVPGAYDVGGDPRLAQITARHALSHTTGFPNWRRGALAIELPPGTQFSYSGEGIVYLARVIERITGEPFEAFMQRTVFGPLGMTHSSYEPPRAGTDAASQHDTRGNPVERPPTSSTSPPALPSTRDRNPAAGLRTTAEDYARFVIAVLHGTGLSPAARARMLTPQVHVIDGGPISIGRANPRPVRDLTWGLGWGLQDTAAGPAFWHWGDNGDAKAFVVALDRPQRAVVVFANSANGLSITSEIVATAIGVAQPGVAWLDYELYSAPGRGAAAAPAPR
jgi:CubicO group peptidase (beta-lactamase class C family)